MPVEVLPASVDLGSDKGDAHPSIFHPVLGPPIFPKANPIPEIFLGFSSTGDIF
jgi:hypothetical protein